MYRPIQRLECGIRPGLAGIGNGDELQRALVRLRPRTGYGAAVFLLCWRSERRLAGAAGLEPVTSAVTGQRSNQLSYAPAWSTESLRETAQTVKSKQGY